MHPWEHGSPWREREVPLPHRSQVNIQFGFPHRGLIASCVCVCVCVCVWCNFKLRKEIFTPFPPCALCPMLNYNSFSLLFTALGPRESLALVGLQGCWHRPDWLLHIL